VFIRYIGILRLVFDTSSQKQQSLVTQSEQLAQNQVSTPLLNVPKMEKKDQLKQ